jgi:hypothetical protein
MPSDRGTRAAYPTASPSADRQSDFRLGFAGNQHAESVASDCTSRESSRSSFADEDGPNNRPSTHQIVSAHRQLSQIFVLTRVLTKARPRGFEHPCCFLGTVAFCGNYSATGTCAGSTGIDIVTCKRRVKVSGCQNWVPNQNIGNSKKLAFTCSRACLRQTT